MWGAATLNTGVYEEVEGDPRATKQALAVVALASLSVGFGASGWNAGADTIVAHSVVIGIVGVATWASWAFLTFEIGTRVLPERQTRADIPELLRTIGFSSSPALLLILGALGGTTAVFAITSLWMLATMVVAVRQALDYSTTTRAIAVCVLGWVLTLGFVVVLGMVFGPALEA
jgi:hypothetical protein